MCISSDCTGIDVTLFVERVGHYLPVAIAIVIIGLTLYLAWQFIISDKRKRKPISLVNNLIEPINPPHEDTKP